MENKTYKLTVELSEAELAELRGAVFEIAKRNEDRMVEYGDAEKKYHFDVLRREQYKAKYLTSKLLKKRFDDAIQRDYKNDDGSDLYWHQIEQKADDDLEQEIIKNFKLDL
jgi:D-alanine-D-alanine ligase-like ATP-grasp enzyme